MIFANCYDQESKDKLLKKGLFRGYVRYNVTEYKKTNTYHTMRKM